MYFLIHCSKRVRDTRAIKGSIKEFVIQFAKHSIVEVENHIIPRIVTYYKCHSQKSGVFLLMNIQKPNRVMYDVSK